MVAKVITLLANFEFASAHAKNKSVVSVPGDGNFFSETFLAAGIPLEISGGPVNSYYKKTSKGKILQIRSLPEATCRQRLTM